MTRRLVAAALALLAVLALSVPATFAATPKTSLPDVEDEVMCVSCRVALNVAESPQAYRQRELIRTLVDQGLTKDQIKDRLVAEYGPAVLAMPKQDDGLGWAAYAIPVVVVVVLVALAMLLLPRWRRRAPAPMVAAGAGAGAGSASDAELARLDADLRARDR
ncbi:MAG TPA: cytochrome c-type biogenesis protein CcmH [Solirubrobacteraceae bacterium]|nr:cytochrome c-type biogenesis protein CcmH [Solirubrobacteraceae bacterium]